MLIKVISDTHCCHTELTDLECDVLIHAGDACSKGTYTEGLNFIYWFVKQPAKYKILVPGNHDRALKYHAELIILMNNLGITVLDRSGIVINGVNFWGCNLVPKFDGFGNHKPSDELVENPYLFMPNDEVDVLITHAPPQNVLDLSERGHSLGCELLRTAILKNNPRYHVFGHVHETQGKSESLGRTTCMNVAVMNRMYLVTRGATSIDIPVY